MSWFNLLSSGYKKISNYTILLDLKKTPEELWKQLEKKSIRWGIKTAEKNGIWGYHFKRSGRIQKDRLVNHAGNGALQAFAQANNPVHAPASPVN